MKSRDELEQEIIEKMQSMRDKMASAGEKSSAADTDTDAVPYDKEAARDVIQKFIENHPDKQRFVNELKNRMDKNPE